MLWDLFGTEKLRKNIRPLPSIPGPVTPPIVRHWGQDCKHLDSGIKRGDVVDSGTLSDLDDVEDIQQWRKADVEIAPMAEHEPLRSDLLCFALIDARTQPLATYLSALALET